MTDASSQLLPPSSLSIRVVGPIEFGIDAELGVVLFVSRADPTIAQWIHAVETILGDPEFQVGFGFVSDRSAVREPAKPAFVREAARYLRHRQDVFARTRWAVLVQDTVGFGMARMGQAYVPETGPDVQIFSDVDAAIAWAAGRRVAC